MCSCCDPCKTIGNNVYANNMLFLAAARPFYPPIGIGYGGFYAGYAAGGYYGGFYGGYYGRYW
jgi:hypothetical protein